MTQPYADQHLGCFERHGRPLVAAGVVLASVLLGTGAWSSSGSTGSSTSMEPTVPEGATVLVDELGPRLGGVHHGDLVVFTNPEPCCTSTASRSPSRRST